MSKATKSQTLTVARSVFLRYGFKRATMNDIAEAAGISRAALYLVFKNKEAVFISVVKQWVDETIADIKREMATLTTSAEKINIAFELWAVRPFEITMHSPEAKELIECRFDFAQTTIREGYAMFEATIIPILTLQNKQYAKSSDLGTERIAHVIASAVHGFKQAATTPKELRLLIEDLLALSLSEFIVHS